MQRVADYIATNYDGKLVEIGVGSNTDTADALRRTGLEVVVTDIEPQDHQGFVQDDVTDPDLDVYRNAELIYSVRPPYELHQALSDVAQKVKTDLLIVPLADEDSPLDYELRNHRGRALYLIEPE